MPHSPNIDDLDTAKVIDANKVTPDAQKVIDRLTPPELQAIKSAFAKIDPKNQAPASNVIQMAGF
jgi:hypothetical protein